MTNININTANVLIPNNDLLIDAYLAQPEGNNKKGAGHGFFAGFFVDKYPFLADNPSINREAAIDAWNHVLELFENHL